MLWGYCEEHWVTLPSQFTYRHPPTSCQAMGSTPHQSPAVTGAASVPALSSSHHLTGNTRTDGWGVLRCHSPRSRSHVKVSALRSCTCCLAPGLPGGCEPVPGSEPGLRHPSSSRHPPVLGQALSLCIFFCLKIQGWVRVRRG